MSMLTLIRETLMASATPMLSLAAYGACLECERLIFSNARGHIDAEIDAIVVNSPTRGQGNEFRDAQYNFANDGAFTIVNAVAERLRIDALAYLVGLHEPLLGDRPAIEHYIGASIANWARELRQSVYLNLKNAMLQFYATRAS